MKTKDRKPEIPAIPVDPQGKIILRDGWAWNDAAEPAFDTTSKNCRTFAITVPVAAPLNMEWEKFDGLNKEISAQVDGLHRYALDQYFTLANEGVRVSPTQKYVRADDETVKAISNAIYAASKNIFPLIVGGVRATVIHKAYQKFSKSRFFVWLGKQNKPDFDWHQPIPYRAADLRLRQLDQKGSKRFVLEYQVVPGKVGNYAQILLSVGGARFWRERIALEDAMNGGAKVCEVCVGKMPVSLSCNRHTQSEKDDNGHKIVTRTCAKIVLKKPILFKPGQQDWPKKIMVLKTTTDYLLTFWVANKKFQVYKAANLLRWAAEQDQHGMPVLSTIMLEENYGGLTSEKKAELTSVLSQEYLAYMAAKRQAQRQDFSDDQKALRRVGEMSSFSAKRQAMANNWDNRLSSYNRQVIAMIVKHALRNRITEVLLVETEGRMLDAQFPWYTFKLELKNALRAKGVDFYADDKAEEKAAAEAERAAKAEEEASREEAPVIA